MATQVKPDVNDVWAASGAAVNPGTPKIDLGWIQEKPPFQTMNYEQNRMGQMAQHLNLNGIAEWDSTTEYEIGAYVKESGLVYVGLTATNQGNQPSVSPANWKYILPSVNEKDAMANADSPSAANPFLTESGGRITFRNYHFSTEAMSFDATNPAAGTEAYQPVGAGPSFKAFQFATGVDQYVGFTWFYPEDMDLTAPFKAVVHWTNAATPGAGDVVWEVTTFSYGDSDAIGGGGTSTSQADTYLGVADDMHISPVISFAVASGATAGDSVVFKLGRNGANVADTYTQTARLLGFTIQYKTANVAPTVWT